MEIQPRSASSTRTAVLLVNLGTPDAPTAPAVRRYLRQFLSDPRVVELPRFVWLPLLYGVVLTTRPSRSARKYASIWSPQGSPLLVHTRRQAQLLRQRFKEISVDFAMRYGNPSIRDVLSRLHSEGHGRILAIPMYPQYAASTTGAVIDEIDSYRRRVPNAPEIRIVTHFMDDPLYVRALAGLVRRHWESSGRSEKLVMSFHGLPQRTIDRGDPYRSECQRTAALLAQELELPDEHWQLTFQSRFGRAKWIEPYTASTLADYARRGIARVDVVCPGFVSDCLETLEELGIEGRALFLGNGGKEFHLLPCLNERDDWIDALEGIARHQISDWGTDVERARPSVRTNR